MLSPDSPDVQVSKRLLMQMAIRGPDAVTISLADGIPREFMVEGATYTRLLNRLKVMTDNIQPVTHKVDKSGTIQIVTLTTSINFTLTVAPGDSSFTIAITSRSTRSPDA